jgi:hypothetical protein
MMLDARPGAGAGREVMMAMDRTFQEANARERERLGALVARLGDADLERPVGDGWTVATTLAHLAFWDLRAATLMDRLAKTAIGASPVDIDVINDTVKALAAAIPPRTAARLAVDAAEAADRRIEALTDQAVEAIDRAGSPFNLARHLHRGEHLDEIERALPR